MAASVKQINARRIFVIFILLSFAVDLSRRISYNYEGTSYRSYQGERMKYIIKNKFFSLGDGSTVKDENDRDLFKVKGSFLSLTRKKYVCTLSKQPLFIVRNKLINLLLPKVFIFDAQGNKLMTLKKRGYFSFKQNFEIIPEPGLGYAFSIDGDIIGRHYDILENGIPVAHVRRNYNLIKDSFWLETDMEEKAPFFIAFVIAMDNYFDNLTNESN